MVILRRAICCWRSKSAATRHRPDRGPTSATLASALVWLLLAAHVAADEDQRFTLWPSNGFREVLDLNVGGDRLEQREEPDADAILSLRSRIHSHAGVEYEVPIPTSFTNADVYRLSDAGQIVGTATRPLGSEKGSQLAFVRDWQRESTELLRPPASYRGSCAWDITSDGSTACGFVVGRDPPRVQPAVWHRQQGIWTCQVLETDLPYNPFLVAGHVAISDDGQRVVASVPTVAESSPNASARNRLCQWKRADDGSWERRVLSDHAVHVADVNDNGMVAGRITRRGRRLGYVFHPKDGPHTLEPFPGDHNAEATALNNHDVVVGISDDPRGPEGGTEAFVWRQGTMKRLDLPGDVIFSSARTIQDSGQVGGWLLRRSSANPDQVESGSFILRTHTKTDEAETPVR